MSKEKPESRSEATAPEATAHLTEGQKQSLDKSGEAEHAIGTQREKLTKAAKKESEGTGQDERQADR